VPAVE